MKILKPGVAYQFSVDRLESEGGLLYVINEEAFVDLIVDRGLTAKEAHDYGVSHRLYNESKKYYREKYKAKLKENRSRNHAEAVMGNTRGSHPPKVDIDPVILKDLVDRGLLPVAIARKLRVSEFLVRRNLNKYKLLSWRSLPPGVQDLKDPFFERLCYLCPGLQQAAENYDNDPLGYFECVYEAFVSLQFMLWYTKSLGKRQAWYLGSKRIPKTHICWSSNKPELLLAEALRAKGIQFTRQEQFRLDEKLWQADFFIKEQNLAIELNGSVHTLSNVKDNDERKIQAYIKAGITSISIPTREVENNPDEVAECIVQQRYPPSWRWEKGKYGT